MQTIDLSRQIGVTAAAVLFTSCGLSKLFFVLQLADSDKNLRISGCHRVRVAPAGLTAAHLTAFAIPSPRLRQIAAAIRDGKCFSEIGASPGILPQPIKECRRLAHMRLAHMRLAQRPAF